MVKTKIHSTLKAWSNLPVMNIAYIYVKWKLIVSRYIKIHIYQTNNRWRLKIVYPVVKLPCQTIIIVYTGNESIKTNIIPP